MSSKAITYGKRIAYQKKDNLLISHKIFTDGTKMVRVIIDTELMVYKFVDPVTGVCVKVSDKKITNLEVLQRHVKRDLQKVLGCRFDQERRNVAK